MKQLNLFDQAPQAPEPVKYFYKVRFTNVYGRQSDDYVKIYNNEEDARQAIKNWTLEEIGNVGIMNSTTRTALSGLIS